MPTYAQLQAESWWNREIRTDELKWLGDELCRRTKRPRTAAGDKGDQFHLNGAHRSQEWILHSRWCTSRTYTVQSGLTGEQARHIAGFDFTPGSDSAMVAQCKRLMAALKAGRLEEVREFYGNADGDRVVDGWDNLRNRAATSDSSHLWHWHLSIDRTKLRDRRLMERIVAIALGDTLPEEDDVSWTEKLKVPSWMMDRWPDSWKDGTFSAGGALASDYGHSRSANERTATLLKEQRAGFAALLAAQQGDDVAAAVRAELDAAAQRERAERAAEQGELVAMLEQATRERADLAELVRQGQAGELAAEEVVRLLGEKLSTVSGEG